MKIAHLISVMVLLAVFALFGCGGKDTDDSHTPGLVMVTGPRTALADGIDAVTVSAYVYKPGFTFGPENFFSGEPVADGVTVAFSADSGILSTSTADTINGIASITLTHAPIAGANNQPVLVRAVAGSVSGAWSVNFINQPASADVFIGFSHFITNVAALEFTLKSPAGVTFDNAIQPISVLAPAAGMTVTGAFDPASNGTTFSLSSSAGHTIGSAVVKPASSVGAGPPLPPPPPFIKATFAIAPGAGLPAFSIDETAPVTAAGPDGNAIVPPVTAADLVVLEVRYDTQ